MTMVDDLGHLFILLVHLDFCKPVRRIKHNSQGTVGTSGTHDLAATR